MLSGNQFSFASSVTSQLVLDRIMSQSMREVLICLNVKKKLIFSLFSCAFLSVFVFIFWFGVF